MNFSKSSVLRVTSICLKSFIRRLIKRFILRMKVSGKYKKSFCFNINILTNILIKY